MTAMMANPKKRPYQPALGGDMSIQEYNTRKKYADMGFSERMTDFFYGADKMKAQAAMNPAPKTPQGPTLDIKDPNRRVMAPDGVGITTAKHLEDQQKLKRKQEWAAAQHQNALAKTQSPTLSQYVGQSPIQRDVSGYPAKPNRVTSLRNGAGINPTQSTYGFSSMQPSNRAGELYTIDQWGNKRYR